MTELQQNNDQDNEQIEKIKQFKHFLIADLYALLKTSRLTHKLSRLLKQRRKEQHAVSF